MNPNTGAIAYFETDADAKAAGHTVPLSKEVASHALKVPRSERASTVLDFAKLHPLGRLPGMTEDDIRQLRNAAKRARRARRG